MRKLLFAAALLLVSAVRTQADTLLTPDGTLFNVDVKVVGSTADITTASDAQLILTTRRGSDVKQETIPATIASGEHVDPALAYDSDSGALFVFWIHRVALWGSELLFASRDANGVWSEPTQFGGRMFDMRDNLRIAVTRKVLDEETGLVNPGISVHAVWWEFDTHLGEWFAQYQMLTIVNGHVAEEPAALDLREFARQGLTAEPDGSIDIELLRHPMLFPTAKQDSVVLVFGDTVTKQLHEVSIHPSKAKSQGRLRVPVGRHNGSTKVPTLSVAPNSRIDGVYGDTDRVALYSVDGNSVRYVLMKDGKWTAQQQITLDSQITSAAAVDALRRLVSDN